MSYDLNEIAKGGGFATDAQIKYTERLLRQLGYDPDDYNLDCKSKREVSNLIDMLKEELG